MRRITATSALLLPLLTASVWLATPSAQQAPAIRAAATPARPAAAAAAPATVPARSPYVRASGAAYGNADAITQDELKVYDYFLASDQLEGRNLPSRGYDIAALYIASHLKEWGLKPGGSATGTDGPLQPYFQPFELVSTQPDAANMKLSLNIPAPAGGGGRGGRAGFGGAVLPAGPHAFDYGKEWTVAAGGGRGAAPVAPAEIDAAPLVFVGHGYVVRRTQTDPYKGLDVKGKVLVVAGMPAELAAQQAAALAGRGGAAAGGGRAGAQANPLGVENVDFITPQAYAAKNGAIAIINVPSFQQLSAMTTPAAGRGSLNGPPYQVVKFQVARAAAVPQITAGVELTNALFQGEKIQAAQVFNGAAANARLESFELSAEKRVSLRVAVTTDRNHAENVVGILEGRDPVLKNEYVVMSAHLDHVGLATPDASGDGVNNGADDDASGSAALMAIARVYADGAAKGMRPKRSTIFLWVAGEEKGLWGSQYFNQFPPIDIKKVVVDLNMDMIGRTKTAGYVDPASYKLVEPNEVFLVGPNIASDELGKVVRTVNDAYLKMKINDFYDAVAPDATHDNLGPGPQGQRIFYRSDHYNFVKMGIPIAFFADGLHVDYHRVTDSPDKIDYQEMQAVTRTVAAVGWVIGNTATPPKLNTKLPEQLVNDMKAVQEQGWGRLTPAMAPLPGMPF
jgi:Zn-dependent M28 family amino/carboxypeptidase